MTLFAGRSILAIVFLTASTVAAMADRIDGNWCSPAGATMSIEGTRGVTPGGNIVKGRYDRHNFDYEIPKGESNAGGRVSASQIDDQHIRVTAAPPNQAEPAPHAIWTRCEVVS